MKTTTRSLALFGTMFSIAVFADELPSLEPDRIYDGPEQGWRYFFGGCSWYCGAPAITVAASSVLTESSGLTHPATGAHDRKMEKVWSEGVEGTGVGEQLVFSFHTTEKDTTDLGVTTCAVAIGHQASEELFRQNGRPRKLEVIVDGKSTAVLNLKDVMGLQFFKIPRVALERPSEHRIALKIVEVYAGSKFEDTCIAEVYFQGTGKMH